MLYYKGKSPSRLPDWTPQKHCYHRRGPLSKSPCPPPRPSWVGSRTVRWSRSTPMHSHTCADTHRRIHTPGWSVATRDSPVGLWCGPWTGPAYVRPGQHVTKTSVQPVLNYYYVWLLQFVVGLSREDFSYKWMRTKHECAEPAKPRDWVPLFSVYRNTASW